MFVADKLTKTFGVGDQAVRALNDVSLTIAANEFFTLLGPSGCGKTTLLRSVAGFEQVDAGTISLGDTNLTDLPAHQRPVNTVFQNYALFPHLTVSQNVAFGLESLGWKKAEVKTRVHDMLMLVHMEKLATRRVSQISGGQQQRVALARALAPRPKLLLLDEPLSALDFKLRRQMQLELKRIQRESEITFIFVTHDQTEALTMSDRIGVMSSGELLQVGSPQEVYHSPSCRFVAEFIGETNFVSAMGDGSDTVVLADGTRLKTFSAATGPVTLSIRPERAVLASSGIPATVEQTVFFGTDSNVHLRLSDGAQFVLRIQPNDLQGQMPSAGDAVHIAVEPDAVRVLEE